MKKKSTSIVLVLILITYLVKSQDVPLRVDNYGNVWVERQMQLYGGLANRSW